MNWTEKDGGTLWMVLRMIQECLALIGALKDFVYTVTRRSGLWDGWKWIVCHQMGTEGCLRGLLC